MIIKYDPVAEQQKLELLKSRFPLGHVKNRKYTFFAKKMSNGDIVKRGYYYEEYNVEWNTNAVPMDYYEECLKNIRKAGYLTDLRMNRLRSNYQTYAEK